MTYKIPSYWETEQTAYLGRIKRLCELMAVDENIDTELLYLNVIRDIGKIKEPELLKMTARDTWIEIARIIKSNIKLATNILWKKDMEDILNDLE